MCVLKYKLLHNHTYNVTILDKNKQIVFISNQALTEEHQRYSFLNVQHSR